MAGEGYLPDGYLDFSGGQNDGLLSSRISPNQYRRGINVRCDRGVISPRFAYESIDIIIKTSGKVDSRTYQQIYNNGKFQAGIPFKGGGGYNLVVVISGTIFSINPLTGEGVVLKGARLNQYKRRVNWTVADRFLILYDHPNYPVIIENLTARRANPNRTNEFDNPLPEVPLSTIGAYVQNRLHVGSINTSFVASDPVGGINSEAPVIFEESLVSGSDYFNQVFTLGNENKYEGISAMGYLQQIDTSTGYGPLVVATKYSVYTANVHLPRTTWGGIAPAFESGQFIKKIIANVGVVGQRALANLNSDMMFMSANGKLRAISTARDSQQRWNNVPISREIDKYLETKEDDWLEATFIQPWKDRIFISANPYMEIAYDTKGNMIPDYAFKGMVVMNLDNISRFGQPASPVYDGLWTGIDPMEMIILGNDSYVIAKEDGGANQLYKINDRSSQDVYRGITKNIQTRIYTRRFLFDSPFEDKEEFAVDFQLSEIEGNFNITVYRKSNAGCDFTLWREANYKLKENCDPCELGVSCPLSFNDFDLGDPKEVECNKATNELTRHTRSQEFLLSIIAKNFILEGMRVLSKTNPINTVPKCKLNEEVDTFRKCKSTQGDFDISKTGVDLWQNVLTTFSEE